MPDTERQKIRVFSSLLESVVSLTANVDSETESRLDKASEVALRGRTSIVIAHRLSTVRRADLIVVIERGRIIETGKHSELLALGGAYRRLYELQFADEEEGEEVVSSQ